MAGIYPDINFPKIDFSILGNLPQTIEEAQGSASLKASLADLKDSSPDELDRAAARILSSPGLTSKNAEIALRLQEQARKSRADVAYGAAVAPLLRMQSGLLGGGKTPDTSSSPPPLFPGSVATPDATPAAPGPFGAPGGVTIGPAPSPSVEPPPEPPAPGGASLSPSDQTIAAAQAAMAGGPPPAPMVPPPPGPQLAGPLPVPDTGPAPQGAPLPGVLPGTQSQPGLPPFMQGAQVTPPPVAPPAPPKLQGQPPTGPLSNPELNAQIQAVGEQAIRMGPKASPTQRAYIGKLLDQVLGNAAWDAPTKELYRLNLERYFRGESQLSIEQYNMMKDTRLPRWQEQRDDSKPYIEGKNKAYGLKSQLQVLENIANHPQFISGEGVTVGSKIVSGISGLRDMALSLGVPQEMVSAVSRQLNLGDNFEKLTKPTQLMEVFNSLSNEAIYQKLGSLGSNISNSDKDFVLRAFPSLSLSKPGNQLLIQVMKAITDHNIDLGKKVDQFVHDHQLDPNAPALRQMVDHTRDNSNLIYVTDGKGNKTYDSRGNEVLTPLGRKIQDAMGLPPEIGPESSLTGTGGSPGGLPQQQPPLPRPAVGPIPEFGSYNAPGMGGSFINRIAPRPNEPRAGGGPVRAGQPYTVGEKGPETFVPTRPGMILPHHEGKVYYHEATGKPVGRIKNGRAVPFGQR